MYASAITTMPIGTLTKSTQRQSSRSVRIPPESTPTAAPLAAVAIVSDLVESVVKRRADRKDSGGGIPGIGGFFDLIDSVILAAPVGYFLLGLR